MNPNIADTSQIIKQNILAEISDDILLDAVQDDSKEALTKEVDENSVAGMLAKTKKLEPQKNVKNKMVQKIEKGLFTRKEMDNLANEFCDKEGNKEYRLPPSALSRLALGLGQIITPETSADDLIFMIRKEMNQDLKQLDVSQIDKAFDFLLEVVENKMNLAEGLQATFLEQLHSTIADAKIKHFETFKVEIETAHSIIGAADVLVTENRSTAESLDHLRKMISEPQDAHTKYKYYVIENGYTYIKLRTEFKLLFQFMGGLVKKRLENSHLRQLLEEIKILQAILGVYKQSDRETSSMYVYLTRMNQLLMNPDRFKSHVNFERLSSIFFEISEERYPVPDKILQILAKFIDGLTKDEHERLSIKISILGAMRNMIREVAPLRLYRSFQHRDDLLAAIIDAAETLEDQLEEFEEDEDEDKEE